jgi:2-dehydro-3-deoxyphosphooctonate aldolase (KDO 8-P synthase)
MKPLLLISGPCAIENDKTPYEVAEKICRLNEKLPFEFIFKSSFKKANRTRLDSFTGIDFEKSLYILNDIRTQFGIPVITDVHESFEVNEVADAVDYLQIPAFLCRQTALLVECGKSGKGVNIKKGQFSSPQSMVHAVEKVRSTGNQNVMLTERGTSFGYQDLIIDYRGIPTMQSFGVPVILDATHSLQQPNQAEGITGGLPHLIETVCKAGIAVGIDGLFIETHPTPSEALSDGKNMLRLDLLEALLEKCLKIRSAID